MEKYEIIFKKGITDQQDLPYIMIRNINGNWFFLKQLQSIFDTSSTPREIVQRELEAEIEESAMKLRKKGFSERVIKIHKQEILRFPEKISEDWKRLNPNEIDEMKERFEIIKRLFKIKNPDGELIVHESAAYHIIARGTDPNKIRFQKETIKNLIKIRESSIAGGDIEWLCANQGAKAKRKELEYDITYYHKGNNTREIINAMFEGCSGMNESELKKCGGIPLEEDIYDYTPLKGLLFHGEVLHDTRMSLFEETPKNDLEMKKIAKRAGERTLNMWPLNFDLKSLALRKRDIEKMTKDFKEVFGEEGVKSFLV